jgi:L-seryl-tRNA(Ser) seleniumtransferase
MHDKIKSRNRRAIPAVHTVLDSLGPGWSNLPRPLVVDAVRRQLSKIRTRREVPEYSAILDLVRQSLTQFRSDRLQSIINGTGIIVNTNFGRAPLSTSASKAVQQIASGYSNLEYDLASGDRGHRGSYVEKALAQLCGAEAATVVNNCAAALVLIVHHFLRSKLDRSDRSSLRAQKPELVISRGELVQIGGGFRIGEILEATGAVLHEVGATNKTTVSDYARAIKKQTALILKVHRSNFFMTGFVETPTTAAIAALAKKRRVPFVEDLGSGAVIATDQVGLHDHEPMPNESLRNGADLVCFSGDKLFGGPQAGIIAGKKRFIAALKCQPLFRALRCDKLSFAALQATVDLHLNQTATDIPAIALLQIPKDELRGRAATILDRLRGLPLQITIGRGVAKIGGGTLPKSIISSVAIDILPKNCSLLDFAAALRRSTPPIVGYVANGRFKLNLRTIFPEQDDAVIDALRSVCTNLG